jgi:hypothetical protein
MSENPRLALARAQIQFAREYTHSLIDDIEPDRWFEMPAGAVTHVGWQVGHLAMAQYMLSVVRLRGKQPEDAELIDKAFLRKFLKGTKPESDAGAYPSPEEIRQVFDGVYDLSMKETAQATEEQLANPVQAPFVVEPTNLGSLFFCSAHEMLHAGQIGLLRRLLGKDPVR